MTFQKTLGLAAMLAVSAVAGVALANETKSQSETAPRGVVELFTSQGCSSCPPADVVFTDLAARPDIVALAYHVDYWDYLGWKDTLSSKENTERQYAYMRAFGTRSVYTPQAVINGRTHVNGADRSELDSNLSRLDEAGQGMRVALKATRVGDGVVIEAGDGDVDPASPSARVVLVYFDAPQKVSIGKGENTGRQQTDWNAVSEIQTAGMWRGKAQRYELPLSEKAEKGGCAVLLQTFSRDGVPGPILGAAMVRKP